MKITAFQILLPLLAMGSASAMNKDVEESCLAEDKFSPTYMFPLGPGRGMNDYRCCAGFYGTSFGAGDSYGECETSSCVENFNSKNLNCFNYGSSQHPIGGNGQGGLSSTKKGGSRNCPYFEDDQAICDVSAYVAKNGGDNCRDNGNNHCLGYVKCQSDGVERRQGNPSASIGMDDSEGGACRSTVFPANTICFYNGNSENWKVCASSSCDTNPCGDIVGSECRDKEPNNPNSPNAEFFECVCPEGTTINAMMNECVSDMPCEDYSCDANGLIGGDCCPDQNNMPKCMCPMGEVNNNGVCVPPCDDDTLNSCRDNEECMGEPMEPFYSCVCPGSSFGDNCCPPGSDYYNDGECGTCPLPLVANAQLDGCVCPGALFGDTCCPSDTDYVLNGDCLSCPDDTFEVNADGDDCECPEGKVDISGSCVDDPCDNHCPPNETCDLDDGGSPICTCPSNFEEIGDTCCPAGSTVVLNGECDECPLPLVPNAQLDGCDCPGALFGDTCCPSDTDYVLNGDCLSCPDDTFEVNANGDGCECPGGTVDTGGQCENTCDGDPCPNSGESCMLSSSPPDYFTCGCPVGEVVVGMMCCPAGSTVVLGGTCDTCPGDLVPNSDKDGCGCPAATCPDDSCVADPSLCDDGGQCPPGEFECSDGSCAPDEPSCGPGGPGVEGDPHFKTWNGTWYDYMGACDLVLLDAPHFDEETSLFVAIRTTGRYEYSYVESAAVQIGLDLLEVGSFGTYFLNGVEGTRLPKTMAGKYPVTHKQVNKKTHRFIIGLGANEEIVVETFKDLVSVNLNKMHDERFHGSLGMLGDYESGKTMDRNGSVEITDSDLLAAEWQVRPNEDGMMFQAARAPQYPEPCEAASARKPSLRLGHVVTQEDAKKSCGHLAGFQMKACVHDVMAIGDLDLAATF